MWPFKKTYGMDDIHPDKWPVSNKHAQKEIAKYLLEHFATELSLPGDIKLSFNYHAEEGMYDDSTKTVYINLSSTEKYQKYAGIKLLNTMAHECKHAEQYALYHQVHAGHVQYGNLSPFQQSIVNNLNDYVQVDYINSAFQYDKILNPLDTSTYIQKGYVTVLYGVQPIECDTFTYAMSETYHYIDQQHISIDNSIVENRILSGPNINEAVTLYSKTDTDIAKHVRQIYRDMCQQNLHEKDIPLFITIEQAMILTHMVNTNTIDQQKADSIISPDFQAKETARLTDMIRNMQERDDDEVIYEDEPDYVQEFQYGTREFQQTHHINEDKETQEQPSHEQSSHDDDEIDFP